MYELKKISIPSGETIAYREAGGGKANILLIHGNQCSSTIYDDFMERYEDRARIIAIDLPGFGDSSYHNQHLKIEDWAKDVDQFMEALGIESALVVGHSAGGGVGLKLATDFGQRVDHLVLIASVGVKGFYLPKLDENFMPLAGEFARTYEEVASHPSMIFVENLIKTKAREETRKMWDQSLYNLKAPDKATYETYIDEFFKERCFTDISVALCEFNITDEVTNEKGDGSIAKITAPVTWIHGEKDLVVPFAIGENSVKYFPNEADFIPIKEAGHMAFNDSPDEFYGHIDEIVDPYI